MTKLGTLRDIMDILSYTEHLVSELDLIYLRLSFYRKHRIAIMQGLERKIIRLYENIMNIYENISNTFTTLRYIFLNAKHNIKTPTTSNILDKRNIRSRAHLLLKSIESQIDTLRQKLIILERYYNYIGSLKLNTVINTDEYITDMILENKFDIIITTQRIFIRFKDSSNIVYYYTNDISSLRPKKSLIFKGLEIKLNDKSSIKIPIDLKKAQKLQKRIKKKILITTQKVRKIINQTTQERTIIRPNTNTLKVEILKNILAITS